jgi:hypothetical protein
MINVFLIIFASLHDWPARGSPRLIDIRMGLEKFDVKDFYLDSAHCAKLTFGSRAGPTDRIFALNGTVRPREIMRGFQSRRETGRSFR